MSSNNTPASHFAGIQNAPPDAILGLSEAFVADPNPQKMNLSVGVYKDENGQTPILQCVKQAEHLLVQTESTKGYLPIDGVADYRRHVASLVFGDAVDSSRICVSQTPGGTGALRQAAAFLSDQLGCPRVLVPSPTWANHKAIFAAERLAIQDYRYLSANKKTLDFAAMIQDLTDQAKPGDVILLHACCHNPTGVDPTPDQWREIAEVIASKQVLPLIDFAYQGFGRGLAEDASSIKFILDRCDEAMVCSSFSKNFGLYSERVGALSVVCRDAGAAAATQSQVKRLIRGNYSNPPRHGAAVVATILDDPSLTQTWHSELDHMRTRIDQLRKQFVETMKTAGSGHDFSFLLDQKGMFSFSGLNPMQVDRLRTEHSLYIVGSGRMNVAGMSENRMRQLCDAIAKVMQ